MKLTQLTNYAFGATYKIEVAVFYAGFLQPYNTTSLVCTVTTPATTTQLSNCNQVLISLGNVVYANNVPFATGYRFRISDPLDASNYQEIERTIREFRMNLITAFVVQYNKQYNIQVAIKNTDGTYLPYGTTCQSTTPLFPTTGIQDAQCATGSNPYAVPSMNTPIFAASYPGAIAYAFRLTGGSLPVSGIEVVKTLRVFNLNDFAGQGIVPGETYNVNVRLIFNLSEPPGHYGKTCSLTVPGVSRIKEAEFNAVAYPNPFAEGFHLDVTTSINEQIEIKIYDMAGRLLDSRSGTESQTKANTLGESYPAGVYSVIVSQGINSKVLKVVKR